MTAAREEKLEDWPVVTSDDGGIRPAGKPDECFYCNRKVGKQHGRECVTVLKRIRCRYTYEIEVDVPHFWGPNEFEFHRNESSSCADNTIRDLERASTFDGTRVNCLCGRFEAKWLEEVDSTPRRDES